MSPYPPRRLLDWDDDLKGYIDERDALAVQSTNLDTSVSSLIETDGTATKDALMSQVSDAVDDSSTSIGSALFDTFAARNKIVPTSNVTAKGHSFMFGSTTSTGGSTTGISDMATLIATGLSLPIYQTAVSGAALYTSASAGDWADRFQSDVRGTAFEPFGGVAVDIIGLNDAANIGHTYSELAPFKSGLRACVAHFRAGAIFEDSHSSVVKTGTWTTNSATNRNSGSTYVYSNTAGDSIVWTPPSSFPGGTLSIPFVAYGDGGSCVWTTTVNGIVYTTNTADYALTGNNPTVGLMRIPNVKRNNGAITFTVSSVSGSGAARAIFDCIMWEPVDAACGVYALIGQPKPLDYTSQSGAPAGPVTDAGVDIINQILQEISAEFGERVPFVDTSFIDKNTNGTFWEAGNVHPNGAGHAYIAEQTVEAIKNVVTIVPTPSKVPVGIAVTPTPYTPVLDGTGTTQGNATVVGSYTTSAEGLVTFSAAITIGSTTVIGSSLRVSLPSIEQTGTLERGRLLARVFRSGTGYYEMVGQLGVAAGKVQLRLTPASPTSALVSPSSTTPLTWAAGDVLTVTGTYRPA